MRNWIIKEAVDTIREGTDFAGMKEIAGFNPVFFKAVCENDVSAVAALMGEKFTLRRLSRGVLEDVVEDDVVENEDVVENDDVDTSASEKATASKSKEDAPVADKPLGDMTTKELIALCNERGIKVPKYGKNKTFYVDALNNANDDNVEDESEDEDEVEVEDEDEVEVEAKVEDEDDVEVEVEVEDKDDVDDNPYEGKNAMSLFKMCKDRGIKAAPRQKAKVYIDLLEAADAASDDDVEDEDDSWADEAEDEKPAAKAPAKGAKGKAPAKSGKKAEPAADDEEWDI